VIIDVFRPDPEGPDHIYKRWRDADGNLIEEVVEDFQPYFWIKASTPQRIIDRALARYPGSSIDWYDRAQALRTNEELVKVYAYRTTDIREMTKEFGQTWEGDLSLTDRYLIGSPAFGTLTLSGTQRRISRPSWQSQIVTTKGM
jgi:hypothetical protein